MAAGNYLHHCVALRYRVSGSGSFESTLFGLEEINSQAITDVTLVENTERYPNQLTNLIEQRMKVEFGIEGIGSYFILRQITFYTKPVATGYPQ